MRLGFLYMAGLKPNWLQGWYHGKRAGLAARDWGLYIWLGWLHETGLPVYGWVAWMRLGCLNETGVPVYGWVAWMRLGYLYMAGLPEWDWGACIWLCYCISFPREVNTWDSRNTTILWTRWRPLQSTWLQRSLDRNVTTTTLVTVTWVRLGCLYMAGLAAWDWSAWLYMGRLAVWDWEVYMTLGFQKFWFLGDCFEFLPLQAGFWPRGQNPRRHYSLPLIYV